MVHKVEEKEGSSSHHQDAIPTTTSDAIPVPQDATIILVSSSLEEFPIKASTLFQSDLFRGLLDHELGFKEYWERKIHLEGISGRWVKRVIEYLEFKEKYNLVSRTSDYDDKEDSNDESRLLPQFEVEEDEAVELTKIADYLQL